ncbi:MAG TPA: hemerythrin domain-containing protein [Holophagaceae bacterium]|nr:hemerythrin domain-containing protein [Holophagaceae bacterium]
MTYPLQDCASLLPVPKGGLDSLTLMDLPDSTFIHLLALDQGAAYGPVSFPEPSQLIPLGSGFAVSGGGPLSALTAHEPILIPGQKAFTLEATAPGHVLLLRFRGLQAPEEEGCSFRCSETAAAGPTGPVNHPLLQRWMNEHDAALACLDRLEAALAATPWDPKLVAPEAAWLAGEVKAHNEAEEQHLFPLLDPHFGDHSPVSCMRDEHRELWAQVVRLQEALRAEDVTTAVKAGTQAIGILRNHIAKENNVLYPMAERLLSPEALAKLTEAFQEA